MMVLPTTIITTMYTHSTVEISNYDLIVSSIGFALYLSLLALMGIAAPMESLSKIYAEADKIKAGEKQCRFVINT